MSKQTWIYGPLYKELFEKLKNERDSILLQPIEYDYYTRLWEELSRAKETPNKSVLEEVIEMRFRNHFEDLKYIRWNKIITHLLRELKIDTSLLTSQETEIFSSLKKIFYYYKSLPDESNRKIIDILAKKPIQNLELNNNLKDKKGIEFEKINLKAVKILQNIPQFYGPNLEMYGPYSKDSIVELPLVLANLLLKKKFVEFVK